MTKNKLNKFLSAMLAFLLSISACAISVPIVQATQNSVEGWAIIVNGCYTDEFVNGSVEAYNALKACGYSDNDICYLDAKNRTQPYLDNLTTKENVEWAITEWLGERSDDNDLCTVFLHNHGEDEIFALNYTYNLPYSELNGWLNNVSYGRLILVVDACKSGSCIDDLNAADRIIVSSCKTGEAGAQNVFSGWYFWPRTVNMTIMEAFNEAAWDAWNYTKDWPPPSEAKWPPHPQLDDNGDGVGHSPDYQDPPEYWLPRRGDGYLANITYLDVAKATKVLTISVGSGVGSGTTDPEPGNHEYLCGNRSPHTY